MNVLLKIPENAIHVNSRSSQIQKFRQPTIFQINLGWLWDPSLYFVQT